jgi:cystathionine beta-lyase
MTFDFDRLFERRETNSIKWDAFPGDVLPLWVADMDFAAPPAVQAVLRAKVEHGIFGYEMPSARLLEQVALRMQNLYKWQVTPDMVLAIPGVVTGFNLAALVTCQPGQGVLIQSPVYPPFLQVHANTGLQLQVSQLRKLNDNGTLHYEIDFDDLEAKVNSGDAKTGLFLLCQPHNPTGGIYTPAQLSRLADICLSHDIFICSDEIHSELLLGGKKHTPTATISPEVADRTITLIAPSKTFNVAGLFAAFAIIPNPDLRVAYKKEIERQTLHVNSLGLTAAQASFSGECDGWLDELLVYLTGNRDFLVDYIKDNLPGIHCTVPDATYLAWLDCTELVTSGKITTSPYEFFLKNARVALNDGATFGSGGEGFVRLNFGCPRATLFEALERMKTSLSGL